MRLGDRLKNPRAALTLPGGVLITAIVKQKNLNSNQYCIRCPVAAHYDHIGQGPKRASPCLPSNDYHQWPATIIDMLRLQYHNILMNVKKKYYMWYKHPLFNWSVSPWIQIETAEIQKPASKICRNSVLWALFWLFCAYGNSFIWAWLSD